MFCKLCLLGVLVGVVLRYVVSNGSTEKFYLAVDGDQCSESQPNRQFQVGDNVVLSTEGGDEFYCSVSGRVFKSVNGDAIESAVSVHVIIMFMLHYTIYIFICT